MIGLSCSLFAKRMNFISSGISSKSFFTILVSWAYIHGRARLLSFRRWSKTQGQHILIYDTASLTCGTVVLNWFNCSTVRKMTCGVPSTTHWGIYWHTFCCQEDIHRGWKSALSRQRVMHNTANFQLPISNPSQAENHHAFPVDNSTPQKYTHKCLGTMINWRTQHTSSRHNPPKTTLLLRSYFDIYQVPG